MKNLLLVLILILTTTSCECQIWKMLLDEYDDTDTPYLFDHNSNFSTGSDAVVSYPYNIQADDVAYGYVVDYDYDETFITPTGWNLIYLPTANSTLEYRSALFYRRLDGTESGGDNVTFSSNSSDGDAIIARIFIVRNATDTGTPHQGLTYYESPSQGEVGMNISAFAEVTERESLAAVFSVVNGVYFDESGSTQTWDYTNYVYVGVTSENTFWHYSQESPYTPYLYMDFTASSNKGSHMFLEILK